MGINKMNKFLRVAEILDKSGHYSLSDEFYKMAVYVPPVEFYDGVDKRLYNDFRVPGSKNYDEMIGSRYKNMPQNLSNTRVMDGSMYFGNPYTPKDILKLRNMIVPTNFRNQLKRFHAGDTEMSSSNPVSFANSLWEFARKNRMNNSLTNAFDAYADAGAMYNGQSIKNIPQLKELYMYIKNNPRSFSETEVSELLKELFSR